MNLTIYPPWFETGRAQSELFVFQCGQWELIWNSQLIGRYKEMSPGESYDIPPHFETGRAQSELFAFQCSQWELIWNSQLIGRYREMSPGESYGQWELIWNSQLIGRYKEMSPGESYDIHPSSTTLPGQLHLTFLRFQLYQVKLLIVPLQHCHNNYS